jgi:membrane-associated HD superfamily phosphohydrolase
MAFFSRKPSLEVLKKKVIERIYEGISSDLKFNLSSELSTINAGIEEEINKDEKRKKATESIVVILERRAKLLATIRNLYIKFYSNCKEIQDSKIGNTEYRIAKLTQAFDAKHQEAYAQLTVLAQQYRELVDILKVRFVLL